MIGKVLINQMVRPDQTLARGAPSRREIGRVVACMTRISRGLAEDFLLLWTALRHSNVVFKFAIIWGGQNDMRMS